MIRKLLLIFLLLALGCILALQELERRYILRVLEHCDGSREQTAATLGINKSTLWRKLQGYREDSPAESANDAKPGS